MAGSECSDSSTGSQFGQDVAHRMNATRMPFYTGILVELCFCMLMTQWMNESDHPVSPLFTLAEGTIIQGIWLVFLLSLLGRSICLWYSHHAILHRRSGRLVTILYMFFGTMQWLFYLAGYYVAYDGASGVRRSHRVNVELESLDAFFPNHTSFTDCLMQHSWNFKACDFGVHGNCSMPYEPHHHYRRGECVSTLRIAGQPCCISETIQMQTPLMTVLGLRCNVSIVFMLTKWLAILLVGWVLRHGYFASQLGTPEFTKDSWLDILDAVIFSTNLELPYVRNPAYGFSSDGSPQKRDTWRVHAVYATFAIAFASAICSSIIYSALVPAPDDSAVAEKEVSDTLELDGNEGQMVMLYQELSDDEPGLLCADQGPRTARTGRALRQDLEGGTYLVRFTDGEEPETGIFPLHQLNPDFSKDESDSMDQPCCSGWLHWEELETGGDRLLLFERRAQVLDAFRSLLCLQLPFLVWRLYFNSFQLDFVAWGGTTMLIGKNALWGLLDIVKILSCGRPDAVVCRCRPVEYLQKATNSKLGQVWVGPSGLVAFMVEIAGSLRAKRLQHREMKIQQHIEWLITESQKTKNHQLYATRLQEVQRELVASRGESSMGVVHNCNPGEEAVHISMMPTAASGSMAISGSAPISVRSEIDLNLEI